MNKSDVSSSITSGFNRATNAQGTATVGNEGTFRYQSNLSQLGVDASFGQKVANSQRQEASALDAVANRSSTASTQSSTAALGDAMSLVKDRQTSNGTNQDWGTGNGADAVRTIAKYSAIEDRVSESLGLGADKSLAKDLITNQISTGDFGLDTKGVADLIAKGGAIGQKLSKLVGVQAGVTLSANDQKKISTNKQPQTAISIASAGVSSISADDRQSAVDNFKYSNVYQEADRNNNTSARNFNANKTDSDNFTRTAEESRTKSESLNASASVLQDNWATMSASYSTYAADKMGKEVKLSTFNSLLQTNPDQAAKMYASAISDIAPGLAPTKPVTTSLKQLTEGTPLGNPLGSGTGPTPTETTNQSFSGYIASVRLQGWQNQTASGAPIQAIVNNEVAAANDAFIATGGQIKDKNSDTKAFVTSLTTEKATNLTPNKDGSNPKVDDIQAATRARLTGTGSFREVNPKPDPNKPK